MSSSEERHVYIDTQYLHAYLFPSSSRRNDEEYIAKLQVDYLLNNHDPYLFLKVPFVVIGETVNNIHRKPLTETEKEDIVHFLLKMMGVEKVDFAPSSTECLKLTNELLKEDRTLDPTDTLIVAQALCDPSSSHLLIKDGAVVASPIIQEINNELCDQDKRKRPLKITSEYKKLT